MKAGKLTIIVGLPGAGKSTKVREIRSLITGLCVEDYHENAIDDSPAVEKSRHYRALIEALQAGHDCVIADIAFCACERREALKQFIEENVPPLRIEWIYFEKAPDKCERNIHNRNKTNPSRTLQALAEWLPRYIIPEGVPTLRVWDGAS